MYWNKYFEQLNKPAINVEATHSQKQALTAHIHLLMENPYSAADDSAAENINYSS